MISEDLKKLILPNLKLHLDEIDFQYIDTMFSECYKTYPEGRNTPWVTLKPHPHAGTIAMQFSMLTGSFMEITDWNYIKTIGERL